MQLSPQQKLRHRLADDVRAADHDGIQAGEVAELLLEQDQAAERRARHEAVEADREAPGIHRMKAVDVLVRVDRRVMTTRSSICGGSGSWTRMPSTAAIGVETIDQLEQLVLGDRRSGSRCSKLSMPASIVALIFERT